MKILATILMLITSLVGFIISYEVAYKKVSQMLVSPSGQPQHTQLASTK